MATLGFTTAGWREKRNIHAYAHTYTHTFQSGEGEHPHHDHQRVTASNHTTLSQQWTEKREESDETTHTRTHTRDICRSST